MSLAYFYVIKIYILTDDIHNCWKIRWRKIQHIQSEDLMLLKINVSSSLPFPFPKRFPTCSYFLTTIIMLLMCPPSVPPRFFCYFPPWPPSHRSLSCLSKGQGIADISKLRSRGMLIVCNLTQCLSSATQTGQPNHPETKTVNVSSTQVAIYVTL